MTLFSKIRLVLSRTSTGTFFSIFAMIGIVLLAVPYILDQKYTGEPYQDILISLAFVSWGLSGLPIIIRQDLDLGVIRIEDSFAIVCGIIMMFLGFGLALVPVWRLLF